MSQIKYNPEKDTTELWVEGEFKAEFDKFHIPNESMRCITAMIDHGVIVGKLLKQKEIQKVLGVSI